MMKQFGDDRIFVHFFRMPWHDAVAMDMSECPPIDINGGIDVLSILGITDDDSAFMPQNPQGNS